jgi:hypothetical protein
MPVPLRSLDETVIAVGRQKVGKSWWLRRYLWERTRATGGYMLATDPNLGFSDDRSIPSRRYASIEGARLGLRKYGGTVVHVLDAPITIDEGRDFAMKLAAASMAVAQPEKAPPEKRHFAPVFYMIDEAVQSEGTTAKGMTTEWIDLFARRRHHGVAVGMTMQSAYYAHRVVAGQATRIEVFPLQDPHDVRRLVELGLDPELAPEVSRLQPREHITIECGVTTGVHRAGRKRAP